jgi:RNA polymerase sigma-70 factor (ECF subfamily)
MSSEISPEELFRVVERAQSGSIHDFQELYSLFGKPIFNFIVRLVGSPVEAEDLTQETFLKVYSELVNLRDPGQFKFWLYRIARNEVYQQLRKGKRRTEVPIDDEQKPYVDFLADEKGGLDPEQAILAGELNEVIRTSLMTLKPKYRDVFVLAVFEKMSYDDISKVVGRSLLSVKTDIYRARLAVKDAVSTYLRKKQ